MYDNSMKYKWDNKHVLDTAVEEAELKGERKKALDIESKLKKEGLSNEFIAEATGLTVGEIEKL